jgi:hypothetical protein
MTQLRRLHLDARVPKSRLGALLDDRLRQLQRQPQTGGDVPCDARNAKSVGPVALDGEIEHDIGLECGAQVVAKR